MCGLQASPHTVAMRWHELALERPSVGTGSCTSCPFPCVGGSYLRWSNLFEKMGLETRQTQLSRDGGVDWMAYDSRAIFGGNVVILRGATRTQWA